MQGTVLSFHELTYLIITATLQGSVVSIFISPVKHRGKALPMGTYAFLWQSWDSDPLQSGSGVHLITLMPM